MKYVLIIFVVVVLTIVYFGRKRERKAFALQDEMKNYESLSNDEKQYLYEEQIRKTAKFCRSINELEKAEKIESGKFDYRNLKAFEIEYMRK